MLRSTLQKSTQIKKKKNILISNENQHKREIEIEGKRREPVGVKKTDRNNGTKKLLIVLINFSSTVY